MYRNMSDKSWCDVFTTNVCKYVNVVSLFYPHSNNVREVAARHGVSNVWSSFILANKCDKHVTDQRISWILD